MPDENGIPPPPVANIEHNLNDVWTVLRRQGESIAEIRQGQNSIVTSLSDFRSELRAIRDIATRPAQPVNWIGIAMLAVTVLIAGGSYANSLMQTERKAIEDVEEDTERNYRWIEARSKMLVEDYNRFGEVEQTAVHAHDMVHKNEVDLAIARERIARLEGEMAATRQELRDVDLYRSRGWNTDSAP